MLKLQHVALRLGGQQILSNINLNIAAGEMVMCLGSNGSGKSSLLKILDRRYPLQQGQCSIDSMPLEQYSALDLAHTVITLTQNPLDSLFTTLTVAENCQLARHRARNHHTALDVDHLAAFNPKLVKHLHTLAGNLSGGEQQALTLALACLAQPKILLLDEHTSALDPHTAEHLMQLTQEKTRAQGITCLINTHHLEQALHYGDRLIALQHGEILRDYDKTTKAQLTLAQLRHECYSTT